MARDDALRIRSSAVACARHRAVNRSIAYLTIAVSTCGSQDCVSPQITSSPVTRATGTPYWPANAALKRASLAGTRVVADEKDRVARAIDSFDHQPAAVFIATDQFGARVEVLPDEIQHAIVRVGDQNLGGPGVAGAGNGRVGVRGHPAARTLVVVTLA